MDFKLKDIKARFEEWLQADQGLSKKVAQDCYSRCKRVEENIDPNLMKNISSEEGFKKVMEDIQVFSVNSCNVKSKAYSMSATLRLAVRKLANYYYPKESKNYPTLRGNYKRGAYEKLNDK